MDVAATTGRLIGSLTVDSLREHIAGAKDPIAGGVTVAASSAALGMALLALTLRVASRRKSFSGDRARLTKLLSAAQRESAKLIQFAGRDMTVYQQYRDSLKRKRGVGQTLRKIVESPMAAAGSAARGVDICAEAVVLVPWSVVSDLGAAATLLAGAVRAILLTVDVNLRQLPSANKLRRDAGKTRRTLEARSSRQLQRVLKKVAVLIASG